MSIDTSRTDPRLSYLPTDAVGADEDDQTIGASFIDTRAVDPCEAAAHDESATRALRAIKKLKPRTQKIVRMRLGLGRYEKKGAHTFVDIAKHYGISAERVRRIYTSAMQKLRDELF